MKCLVSNLVLPLALVASALLPVGKTQAQGNANIKPAIVVSIAKIDEQLADAEFLFQAAGLPKILLDIPKAQLQGGIDPSKPIGGYATVAKDESPKFVIFLPVTDLDMALDKFEDGISERSDAGNGITHLSLSNGNDVFVKENKGWAFASDNKANLTSLPENPVGLLGGLEKKYNVAVQVNAQNVPAEMKQMAIQFMQQAFEDAKAQIAEQEPDLKALTDGVYGTMMIEQIKMLVLDTEQLTIGWATDAMDKSTYIDFTMTANAGSELAKQFDINTGAKSEYTGFLDPNSAAQLNFISKLAKNDIETTVKMMDDYRKMVLAKLEEDESLSDEEMEVTRDMIGAFFQVMSDTFKTGKMDGGATLLLNKDAATFVAGGHVANAKKLEAPLRNLVKVAKNEPDFPDFKLDAAKHGDVTFHTAMVPIPAHNVQGRQIFGASFEVVLGIGENSVYFALGNDCVKTISQVMDASARPVGQDLPQGQLTVSLAPIVKFAADVSDDDRVKELAKKFDTAKNDKIRITSRSIERGATSRIKVEGDVLKLVGEVAQVLLSGGGF